MLKISVLRRWPTIVRTLPYQGISLCARTRCILDGERPCCYLSWLHSVLYFCCQMTNAALVAIARNRPNLIQFRLCLLKPQTSDYLTPEKLNAGFGAILHHCKGLRPLSISGLLMDHVFHYIGAHSKVETRDCSFGNDKALLVNAARLETMRYLWMSSCSVSYGACELQDESGHPDTRLESCPVEKLYVYRTVAGRRFNMPDFVWTVDGDSSESTSYRTGNCSMASV